MFIKQVIQYPLGGFLSLCRNSGITGRFIRSIFPFDWSSGLLRWDPENDQFWSTTRSTDNSFNPLCVDLSLPGHSQTNWKLICSITALGETSPTGASVPCSPFGLSGINLSSMGRFYHQVSWPSGLLRCELKKRF